MRERYVPAALLLSIYLSGVLRMIKCKAGSCEKMEASDISTFVSTSLCDCDAIIRIL